MMKAESIRPLPKRRVIDSKRKQCAAEATWKTSTYTSRLNFYDLPPTAEITLEEFEEWAIHRLKGQYESLSHILPASRLYI